MTETRKNENAIDWICRGLMTLNIFAICGTYISYFQVNQQLVSPLIPKSALSEIVYDTYNLTARAALICGVLFLTGLWFYSFKRKIVSIILFGLSIIFYKVMTN